MFAIFLRCWVKWTSLIGNSISRNHRIKRKNENLGFRPYVLAESICLALISCACKSGFSVLRFPPLSLWGFRLYSSLLQLQHILSVYCTIRWTWMLRLFSFWKWFWKLKLESDGNIKQFLPRITIVLLMYWCTSLTGFPSLRIFTELRIKSRQLELLAHKQSAQDSYVWMLILCISFCFWTCNGLINLNRDLCSYHSEVCWSIHGWETTIDKEAASINYS